MRNLVLLLAIAVCSEPNLGSLHAAPTTSVNAEHIAQLITQLGSANFREREAATQALEAIGRPALDALQQAVLSNDPEVGRRAQALTRQIRKRIETTQFLVPLRLRLKYQDTPVLQALQDFGRRTGFADVMEFVGSKASLANRKITLDTGETSFWEAFDQFCQKAGLVEGPKAAVANQQEGRRLLLEAPVGRGGPRGAMQIVEASSSSLGLGRSWDGRLILFDGKPPRLPTDHAGAVRVRALPGDRSAAKTRGDPILFVVEITPQPKLAWHNLLDLRIDKAVDENGQDLAPALETRHDWSQLAMVGNGGVFLDAQTGQPVGPPRDIPVRLKSGEKPSGVLKEVRGVLAAQVQTPLQAIITVDHILQSAGRTLVGDDGETLKVAAAECQPNGEVHVQIELNDGTSANVAWALRRGVLRPNRIVVANGVVRRGAIGVDSTSPANMVLQDADGHAFPHPSQTEDLLINGNLLMRQICCVFQPRADGGEASKLVYSARRMIVIEVPFTLKDVPLP